MRTFVYLSANLSFLCVKKHILPRMVTKKKIRTPRIFKPGTTFKKNLYLLTIISLYEL